MIASISSKTTMKFTRRDWHIVPDATHPNYFTLKTTKGDVVCVLTFPGNDTATDTTFLNLIASAPVPIAIGMQDMVEMYRDAMVDSKA